MSSSSTKAKVRKPHRKLRLGCLTCKARKIKCLETMPRCVQCMKLGRRCGFEDMDDETKANHRAAQRLNEAIANSRVDISQPSHNNNDQPTILVDTTYSQLSPLFNQISPEITPPQSVSSHLSPWIDGWDIDTEYKLGGDDSRLQLVLPVSPQTASDPVGDDDIISYFERELIWLAGQPGPV